MGEERNQSFNQQAHQNLLQDLLDLKLHHKIIVGTYNGYQEEAFEICEIDLETLMFLGIKYQQESIIWDGEELKCLIDGCNI